MVIWSGGTAKKPATGKQEYKLAARSEELIFGDVPVVNGKVALDKKYEVCDDKGKWGSLPAVKSSKEFLVRVKATVKATGKEDAAGYAASKPGILSIEYGTDPVTGKPGVLNATITASTPQSVIFTQSFISDEELDEDIYADDEFADDEENEYVEPEYEYEYEYEY